MADKYQTSLHLAKVSRYQDDSELKSLKAQVKNLEESNTILVNKYNESVDDSEESYKKVKDLESTIIDLREIVDTADENGSELKKVRSEIQKKDIIIEQLKNDKKNLEKDIEHAETSWKELNKTIKIKDKELYNLQKENKKVKEDLHKAKADFTDLNTQIKNEKKSDAKRLKKAEKKEFIDGLIAKPTEFQCSKCDVKVDSSVKLKVHERSFHEINNSTQTDDKELNDKLVQTLHYENYQDECIQTIDPKELEQEKYPCYYCGINVVSVNHLNEHRRKCRGMSRLTGKVGLPAPVRFFPPAHLSRMMQPRFFY